LMLILNIYMNLSKNGQNRQKRGFYGKNWPKMHKSSFLPPRVQANTIPNHIQSIANDVSYILNKKKSSLLIVFREKNLE
jgi:hypothetical protein